MKSARAAPAARDASTEAWWNSACMFSERLGARSAGFAAGLESCAPGVFCAPGLGSKRARFWSLARFARSFLRASKEKTAASMVVDEPQCEMVPSTACLTTMRPSWENRLEIALQCCLTGCELQGKGRRPAAERNAAARSSAADTGRRSTGQTLVCKGNSLLSRVPWLLQGEGAWA